MCISQLETEASIMTYIVGQMSLSKLIIVQPKAIKWVIFAHLHSLYVVCFALINEIKPYDPMADTVSIGDLKPKNKL